MKKYLSLLTLVLFVAATSNLAAQTTKTKTTTKDKTNVKTTGTAGVSGVTGPTGKQNTDTKPGTTTTTTTTTTTNTGTKQGGQSTNTQNQMTKTDKGSGTQTKPASGKQTAQVLNLEQASSISKPVVQEYQNGNVNWTEQYIEARGSSVIDNERFKIPAQARAMAVRGAVVIAQRNLLEIINGVNVTSETRVQDMIATSDYVYTRVDGLIKGAQQVGEPIERDGMIEVTMRIPLYSQNGLAPVVYSQMPQSINKSKAAGVINDKSTDGTLNPGNPGSGKGDGETQTGTTQNNPGQDTRSLLPEGLVFDFNGQQIDPALFPVVVDESGNLLLDLSNIYNPQEGEFPKLLQSTRTVFDGLGFKKGVEVLDVVNSEDGKIVLDGKSSKKFDWGKLANTVGAVTDIVKFVLALF